MVTVIASDTIQYQCDSSLYFPTPCDQYAIVCDITIPQDMSGTVRLKMTVVPDIPVEILVKYTINGVIIDDALFRGTIPSIYEPLDIVKDINVDLKAGDVVSVAIMNKCYYGSSGYDYMITPFQICFDPLTLGDLDISSTPEGASIYIDDILQTFVTPATITDLIEGTHTYRLTLDGYNDATGTFNIVAGQTTTIVEVLEPTIKDGRLGPLIISALTLGMILPAKDCNEYTTKEECEKHGCKWENGICIKK